jgi:O-antigen/teichoic acid export membrane protein
MKILRNVFFLYGRLIISMVISLYTSRVVLSELGIVDYGLYNVVGGVVVMMAFLNHAMTASTQRFLTFWAHDKEYQQRVFNNSRTIHVVLAIVVLILGETVGLYVLKNYILIPPEREFAIGLVYQFSLFSFLTTILNVSNNAMMVAKEELKFFSLFGVLETFLKLLGAYLLIFMIHDRLIVYSFFNFLIALIIFISTFFFTRKRYSIVKHSNYGIDKRLSKEMAAFAGWNLIGVYAGLGYIVGVNILLNLFFGAYINAARAVAFQVQNAINMVVSNLQLAFNPGIVKNYSEGKENEYLSLFYLSSKMSFSILLILVIPVYLNIDFILQLWLKEVPGFAAIFIKIILIEILINCLSGPMHNLLQATGKVKIYQIIVSSLLLLNMPISYILLRNNYGPEFTFLVSLVISFLALILRIGLLKYIINFNLKHYWSTVAYRLLILSIFTIFLIYLRKTFYFETLGYTLLMVIILIFLIFVIVINREEKIKLKEVILSKIK